MKKHLKGVLAGAAITLTTLLPGAAIVTASPAHATNQQDIEFISLLDQHGIDANALGVQWGRGVCADLIMGATPTEEVRRVYLSTESNFTRELAEWFVAAAITVYCPWEMPVSNGYSPPNREI